MENGLKICTSKFQPEDQVEALSLILSGTLYERMNDRLIKYVVENIEPAGWRGIWCSRDLNEDRDYVVEITNVHMDQLRAEGIILEPLTDIDFTETVIIPLVELYPLEEQPNEHLDMEGTTDVLSQVRFFLNNLVLPWDFIDDQLVYDYPLLSERMDVFVNSDEGIIPPMIVREMDRLVAEGDSIKTHIQNIEEDESQQPTLMELYTKLDAIKYKYNVLKNPVMREKAILQKRSRMKNLVTMMIPSSTENPKIFVVGSQVSAVKFSEYISRLPDALKNLANYHPDSRIHTYPMFQVALEAARVNDTIVLLPGKYSFANLGSLSRGGSVIGLGEVEISGSWASHDILMNVYAESPFTLHSLTVRGFGNHWGIAHNTGKLNLVNCTFADCFTGVHLRSLSSATIENCSFVNSSDCDVRASHDAVIQFIGEKPDKIYKYHPKNSPVIPDSPSLKYDSHSTQSDDDSCSSAICPPKKVAKPSIQDENMVDSDST